MVTKTIPAKQKTSKIEDQIAVDEDTLTPEQEAAAKEKANIESTGIVQEGDSKLAKIESNTNANFDDMVKHVVSTILKA